MDIKIDDDNLYDAERLAKILNVTEKTIHKLLREKVLVGKKLGKKWYVTGAALKAYFSDGKNGGEQK